jgi:hypothetical protein
LAQHDLAVIAAQRALDGDAVVAKGLVVEDAADGAAVFLGLHEVAKQAGDAGDVLVAQLLALAAQALAHLLPHAAGVDQLHLALARFGLAVADDPDVGGDAGVVEHVGGQADDGLTQVVLQHVAADFALAASRRRR